MTQKQCLEALLLLLKEILWRWVWFAYKIATTSLLFMPEGVLNTSKYAEVVSNIYLSTVLKYNLRYMYLTRVFLLLILHYKWEENTVLYSITFIKILSQNDIFTKIMIQKTAVSAPPELFHSL